MTDHSWAEEQWTGSKNLEMSLVACCVCFLSGISSKPVDVPGSVPVIEADGDSGLVTSVESKTI